MLCELWFMQALEKCQLKTTISSLPYLLDTSGELNSSILCGWVRVKNSLITNEVKLTAEKLISVLMANCMNQSINVVGSTKLFAQTMMLIESIISISETV